MKTLKDDMRYIVESGSADDYDVLEVAHTLIHSRQHTSPKRLDDPGPNAAQIERILGAAGAAPDHGELNPWRLIVIPRERRHLLGEAFAEALVERDAEATEMQRQEAREKASRGPFLLLAVARLDPGLGPTHPQERVVAAGCAIQNMLLVAHAMGFGAGFSSGRAMYSRPMKSLFGLGATEQPLCFMTIVTVTKAKPAHSRPRVAEYTSFL